MRTTALIAWLVMLLAAGALLVGCETSVQSVTNGQPFSAAKGRWLAYCPYSPLFWIVSPNYMWLQTSGQLAQVHTTTGAVRLFTSLDGLPLDRGIKLLAACQEDDRALLLVQGVNTPFLWSEKQGWSTLPAIPGKGDLVTLCFDLDGTILAVPTEYKPVTSEFGTELYEYVNSTWRLRRKIPASEQIIPMKYGLALRLSPGRSTAPHMVCDLVLLRPGDVDASTLVQLGKAESHWPQLCVWLGGRLLEYRLPNWNTTPDQPAVRELTASGYKEVVKSRPVELDLQAGQFVQAPRGAPWGVMSVRDKAGRVWTGLNCRDEHGVANRGVTTKPADWMWQVLDPTHCELDLKRGFRSIRPAAANGLSCYEPTTRRGWQQANGVIQYVELDGQGQAKVLAEIPARREGLAVLPQVQSPDGSWWGFDYDSFSDKVFRITPDKKVKLYTVRLEGAMLRVGRIVVSPKGTVVAGQLPSRSTGGVDPRQAEMTYKGLCKFDAGKDAFVPAGDIWDEFSWRIGPYELAAVPVHYGTGGDTPVMQKVNGVWKPFVTNFCPKVPSIVGGGVRGDRMLLTFGGLGVVEYDGKHDLWARLVDDPYVDTYCGSLDSRGRRILAATYHVLIYDGDPFAAEGWHGTNLPPLSADEEETLQRLLKQLESPPSAEVEAASKELMTLAPRAADILERIAADKQQPPEIRGRASRLIDSATRARYAATLPALLWHDSPTPAPPTPQENTK